MDIEAIFRRAKRAGVIHPGFVGTFAQVCEWLPDAEEARAEYEAELRVERWYEERGGLDTYEEEARIAQGFYH